MSDDSIRRLIDQRYDSLLGSNFTNAIVIILVTAALSIVMSLGVTAEIRKAAASHVCSCTK